jgi:hypothetical protein
MATIRCVVFKRFPIIQATVKSPQHGTPWLAGVRIQITFGIGFSGSNPYGLGNHFVTARTMYGEISELSIG